MLNLQQVIEAKKAMDVLERAAIVLEVGNPHLAAQVRDILDNLRSSAVELARKYVNGDLDNVIDLLDDSLSRMGHEE